MQIKGRAVGQGSSRANLEVAAAAVANKNKKVQFKSI